MSALPHREFMFHELLDKKRHKKFVVVVFMRFVVVVVVVVYVCQPVRPSLFVVRDQRQ